MLSDVKLQRFRRVTEKKPKLSRSVTGHYKLNLSRGQSRPRRSLPCPQLKQNMLLLLMLRRRPCGCALSLAKSSALLTVRQPSIVITSPPLPSRKMTSFMLARNTSISIIICYVIRNGSLRLKYCPTEDMTADVLTKALPSPKAKHFASALGLHPA